MDKLFKKAVFGIVMDSTYCVFSSVNCPHHGLRGVLRGDLFSPCNHTIINLLLKKLAGMPHADLPALLLPPDRGGTVEKHRIKRKPLSVLLLIKSRRKMDLAGWHVRPLNSYGKGADAGNEHYATIFKRSSPFLKEAGEFFISLLGFFPCSHFKNQTAARQGMVQSCLTYSRASERI